MKKRIWKNRDFTWLVTGQTASQFGFAISNFAIPWFLLQLTGSGMQMGFAFSVGFIPYLILSLPAGAWADKFDRKKIMLLADTARFILISTIPLASLFSDTTIVQLYIVQGSMSAFSAIFDAAYGASLPSIVKKEELAEANAILQTGISTSQILGPALGGSLIALFGAPHTIIITGIAYFISVLTLLKIKKSFKVTPVESSVTLKAKMIDQIKEGFIYVWSHKLIRLTGFYSTMMNFVIFSTGVALLFKIQHELGLTASSAGIMTASFSAGSVLGSLVSNQLMKRLSMNRILKLVLLVQIIPPFIIAFSNQSVVIAAAYGTAGLMLTIWNIQIITLRQSIIPDHLIGRATTSIRLIGWCTIPIGNAFGGTVSDLYSSTPAFLVDGVFRVIMLAMGVAFFKENRQPNEEVTICA